MIILRSCLRIKIDSFIFSTIKRPYSMCRSAITCNKHELLSANQSSVQHLYNRCFMKKMGLKSMYDVYNKKAAKDKVSTTEYELIYNGTGEIYVRCLSGIIVAAMIIMPSIFIGSYVYLLFTEEKFDLNTYMDLLSIPHSSLELAIMLPVLFLLKIASYSFISKYVLRIYRHNIKTKHISVYINPILPWKNVTCTFDKAIKLPDGKIFLVPWHKAYYKLSGYKSIVLRERFRRPIDYDRMLGIEKLVDE